MLLKAREIHIPIWVKCLSALYSRMFNNMLSVLLLSLFLHHFCLKCGWGSGLDRMHKGICPGYYGCGKHGSDFIVAHKFHIGRTSATSLRLGKVVVIISFVNKHQRDEIRRIQIPISQPSPKAIVAIQGFYFFVVRRAAKRAADLLSSSFFGEASSTNILSALSFRSCICLTLSPTCFIESTS